ncbi:MAG: PfkB family carbohydrate kinase [Hyphomicrobium sp.]|nr:PfkB family carbohydrate kinase [Hyphomicrobium sp.]
MPDATLEFPVIVIGHSAWDNVYRIAEFPDRPTKVRALEHAASGGGVAANAAAAISRLGGRVELWSRVGGDRTGEDIIADLARLRVGTSHVQIHPGARSSTAAVIVDGAGGRLVIGERDHAMPSSLDGLPLDTVASAGAILSDNAWREATVAAFLAAREAGVPCVLDVDVGAGHVPDEVLALASHAIFSAPALESRAEGGDLASALAAVRDLGRVHAGVTRGAEGYVWLGDDGQLQSQPPLLVPIVDTTGAGDAFHGAFTLALARGFPDAECARIASATAALACRGLGARRSLPAWSEVDALLRERTGRGIIDGAVSPP